MAFYLDDYPSDDDRPSAGQTCPHCFGTSFYDDPITGALTCSSCFTQSQTATQEELDYDEGIGLAATAKGKRVYNNKSGRSGGKRGRVARPVAEYDNSKRLPNAESCCLAFQWLLWDASKCVSKLAGIRGEDSSTKNDNNNDDTNYWDENNGNDDGGRPSIMERTVKKIWFAYLNAWMEATREHSANYPEMRVSFRDYFLDGIRKALLMKHLSVTVGKKVESEILEDMQKKYRKNPNWSDEDEGDDKSDSSSELSGFSSSIGGKFLDDDDDDDDNDASRSLQSVSNSRKSAPKSKKRKRQPYLTIAQLCMKVFPKKTERHPNGMYQMHPHHAAFKIQPSLTLLLSILQLALTHLRTGVAPHHLTMWVANGQLPHGLNGYALLPSRLKERVKMVESFFATSFVPPASAVANLTHVLSTACGWYDIEMRMITNGPSDEAGFGRTDASRKNWAALHRANASLPSSNAFRSSEMDYSSANGSPSNSVSSSKMNMMAVDNTWYQKSLYNVPLLAARMVQDFGFDQRVFDIAMALMGVADASTQSVEGDGGGESDDDSQNESKNATVEQNDKNHVKTNTIPFPLKCVSHDKLYTPLHVAAVIVMACKLCPGWETWKITSLHAGTNINNSGNSKQRHSSPVFVPWDESQFQLLGNGPTLNHYMDFLEETAFNGVEPPSDVTRFFQSLQKGADAPPSSENDASSTKPAVPPNKGKITPNNILSGAPNPNYHVQYNTANNIGRYTFYQYHMRENKKVLGIKPYHPHYCRLLEYICYVIEETNTGKLHDMVEEFEMSYFDDSKTKSN